MKLQKFKLPIGPEVPTCTYLLSDLAELTPLLPLNYKISLI